MALPHFIVTFRNDAELNPSTLYWDSDNSGKLRFASNAQATLNPGTLTPWQASPDFDPNGSVIYLFGLNTILSKEQIAGMKFDKAWRSAYYDDGAMGRYWAVTPKEAMTVNKGDYADLSITHITLGSDTGRDATKLRVTYYNVDGLTLKGELNHNDAHVQITMCSRQPLPRLADKIDCSFFEGHIKDHDGVPNVVWVRTSPPNANAMATAFSVRLQPKAGESAIKAGPKTTLSLSFLGGESAFSALASPDDIANIVVTPMSSNHTWTVSPRPDERQPGWVVQIPEGSDLDGVLIFENVISRLEPGWTHLTVQFKGVPDYREDEVVLPMFKYGPPVLHYATAKLRVTRTFTTGNMGFDGSEKHRIAYTAGATLSVQWACYSVENLCIDVFHNTDRPENIYPVLPHASESGWLEYDVTSMIRYEDDPANDDTKFGETEDRYWWIRFTVTPLDYPFLTYPDETRGTFVISCFRLDCEETVVPE